MADWPELAGPPDQAARRLLGAVLEGDGVAARLTEVEAYGGAEDPGSHAWRGRTARNATMFEAAGRLYCYRIYGMHICANVVSGDAGRGAAVLLRAGEVVTGVELARERRAGVRDRDLARGPANLCRALGLRLDHDGTDLAAGGHAPSLVLAPTPVSSSLVIAGPRVGLRRAAGTPWRLRLEGEPTVSPYRRHPQADSGLGSAS